MHIILCCRVILHIRSAAATDQQNLRVAAPNLSRVTHMTIDREEDPSSISPTFRARGNQRAVFSMSSIDVHTAV